MLTRTIPAITCCGTFAFSKCRDKDKLEATLKATTETLHVRETQQQERSGLGDSKASSQLMDSFIAGFSERDTQQRRSRGGVSSDCK